MSRDGWEPLLYKNRRYTMELVFGQIKGDGRKSSMNLHDLVKVLGEVLLLCLVHNVNKIVKKVLQDTGTLPGKYSKLNEEAMFIFFKKGMSVGM